MASTTSVSRVGRMRWWSAGVVGLANALQVGTTWWIIREAAVRGPRTGRRPGRGGGDGPSPESSHAATGALRVGLLVLANALQVSATWWFYRHRGAAGGQPGAQR